MTWQIKKQLENIWATEIIAAFAVKLNSNESGNLSIWNLTDQNNVRYTNAVYL